MVHAQPDWLTLVLPQNGLIQQRDGDGVEVGGTSKGERNLIDSPVFGQDIEHSEPGLINTRSPSSASATSANRSPPSAAVASTAFGVDLPNRPDDHTSQVGEADPTRRQSAGAAVIAALPGAGLAVAVGAGLLGLGVAASVSPALFMVGFSLPSRLLQRVFALVELMRGVTAFLIAPILLFLAGVIGRSPSSGATGALWICLVLSAAGFLGGFVIYWFGKGRLEVPELDRWQSGDQPAWESPLLFSRLSSDTGPQGGGGAQGEDLPHATPGEPVTAHQPGG